MHLQFQLRDKIQERDIRMIDKDEFNEHFKRKRFNVRENNRKGKRIRTQYGNEQNAVFSWGKVIHFSRNILEANIQDMVE